MPDAIDTFSSHADDYDEQRKRLVPCADQLYATAATCVGDAQRVLDLGAGTGLLSAAVLALSPRSQLTLLDGSEAMLEHARKRLPDSPTLVADMRDPLPAGPFDAVTSALAIHHLEHDEQRALLTRVRDVLVPGGVFVNAEQLAGPTPELDYAYHAHWRQHAHAPEHKLRAAEVRMQADRCADLETQLRWLHEAGFSEVDCPFKDGRFAVLCARRPL